MYTRHAFHDQNFKARIATLMADGRERTVTDVVRKLAAPSKANIIRADLITMTMYGILTAQKVHEVTVYRKAEAAV
jgi:hypothetical protein